MSKIDCNSCQELRDNAPEFVQNGVTDRVCNSLKNDTGFNPSLSVTRTDCEDLDAANDCLIGELDDQIEAYDVCDWKKFMHKLLPNLYELLKAMICAICGIWTMIHKHTCQIAKLMEVKELSFGENEFSPGEDVTFDRKDDKEVGVSFDIVGNTGVLLVSVQFKDGSRWREDDTWTDDGNWLICELRLKKSKYGIKHIYAGDGQTVNRGCTLATAYGFDGDRPYSEYGRGRHGLYSNRTPEQWGWNDGYNTVPPGYIYVQLRASAIIRQHKNVTFIAHMPVVFDPDYDC